MLGCGKQDNEIRPILAKAFETLSAHHPSINLMKITIIMRNRAQKDFCTE